MGSTLVAGPDIPPHPLPNLARSAENPVVWAHAPPVTRARFILEHVAAVGEAIDQGADVRGYFVWSLLDNFEWSWGYGKRFGIVRVDYGTFQRTVKDSGKAYAGFIAAAKRNAPQPAVSLPA